MPPHPLPPSPPARVLLLENIHASAEAMFRAAGCSVEIVKAALGPKELRERLAGVNLVGIRSKTHLDRAALEAAPDLLAVGCFCIGTNQVDTVQANRAGVPVFNAPFSNTRSVAELMIGEVIMLTRHLGDRVREMHEGVWKKVAQGSHEIRGKTLGIVGYGHIGSQVGVLAESMGMRVIFYDVVTKLPLGNNRPVASLRELFMEADFITLHVPATPQTEKMIDAGALQAMKKGAMLLNASRGTVVEIDALAAALRQGHLGGAALDVFPTEPESNTQRFASELQGLPNVILTPHIGGSTEEAQASIGREVATSLLKFLKAGATTGAVNFPQVELAPSPRTHRVLNVHRNVPGVLRDINKIVSDLNANIHAQMLSTDPEIGYLLMDIEQDVAGQVSTAVGNLSTDIRTRIVS